VTENWGSNQLRTFRRVLHRDGGTIEHAAQVAGMEIGEARLWQKDDALRTEPFPAEAFEPIAREELSPPAKEAEMARGRRAREPKDDDTGGVLKPIDAARAKRLVIEDIIPGKSAVGEAMQGVSEAFKVIKKQCNIPSEIVRLAIKLKDMEDAKRDHWLRALNAMLREFNLEVIEPDLVDKANGENGTSVIPMKAADLASDDGGLATLGGIESDDELATAGGVEPANLDLTGGASAAEEPFEAPVEELAKQSGRGRSRKSDPDPAYGTGTAAMAAMSKAEPATLN